MVPVRLRLSNFMSYGAEAPELDFDLFHVACLSGKNGQGKSALLDALTWVLWGQARKSSGSQKPDDELVRIGTREMEVDLTFDVEGLRYRAQRLYARSATGKTSKSRLELQVLDADTGDYRPLTAATMRETQQRLDDVVGIDYDTFINSAFLLQGRSDEFTNKRPSERKEILGKILNLGRYEKLADLARAREREAKATLARTEDEIDRLQAVLEVEPAWKTAHAEAEAALTAERERLAKTREAERALARQLATLDAQAREAEALTQQLKSLDERRAQNAADAAQLDARIEQAAALLKQHDQIQRDHAEYEQLEAERRQLDDRRDLYRGIEKQIDQKQGELKDLKNALEKRLHALEVELRSEKKQVDELTARLAEAPAVRARLAEARTAREGFEALDGVRAQRQTHEEELAEVERRLLAQREALNGRRKALDEQIAADASALPDEAALQREQQALTDAVASREALEAEREHTRDEGQTVAEQLRELEVRRNTVLQEQDDLQERLAQLRGVDSAVCPTCGLDLTPAHRAEVEADYASRLRLLSQRLARLGDEQATATEQRDALRARYTEQTRRLEAHEGATARLATLDEQLRRAADARATLKRRRAEAERLAAQLEAKDYGQEDRLRWRAVREALDALPFEAAAYEKLRDAAAQADRYADRLRELEELDARRTQLEALRARRSPEAERLRTQLSEGSAFTEQRAALDRLRAQLEAIGFDPERFNAVRRRLAELAGAGARVHELLNARQNQDDWRQQREALAERLAALDAERVTLEAQHAALQEALQGRDAVAADRKAREQAGQAQDEQCRILDRQLGELNAQLAQAARDRAALKAMRAERKTARAERDLYKQLKAAFGKHGIPSLIIEDTLPEIEDRANVLLDQLTEGRMHVKLETLKETKAGGTRETLEIIITDEQGVPRAYETFSGGEAFRVNFALRIALAQILAERSGVRIRTLVIDEGFGTQDVQGVQNMVEAIQAIQNDFDKILVITHLPQLKEAFPVRIEVEKDPVEGSRFEVLGI